MTVTTESGKSRGFGFVTFVSDKGVRYCLQQLGDPAVIEIEGRQCTVRPVQDKEDRGEGHYLMPARGSNAYLGKTKQSHRAGTSGAEDTVNSSFTSPSVSSIARAHKLGIEIGEVDDEAEDDSEPRKRRRKKKEEIVTVTRRQVHDFAFLPRDQQMNAPVNLAVRMLTCHPCMDRMRSHLTSVPSR